MFLWLVVNKPSSESRFTLKHGSLPPVSFVRYWYLFFGIDFNIPGYAYIYCIECGYRDLDLGLTQKDNFKMLPFHVNIFIPVLYTVLYPSSGSHFFCSGVFFTSWTSFCNPSLPTPTRTWGNCIIILLVSFGRAACISLFGSSKQGAARPLPLCPSNNNIYMAIINQLQILYLHSGHMCCGWSSTGPSKQDSVNYNLPAGKIPIGEKSANWQSSVPQNMTLCQTARQSQVGFSYIKMSIWVSFIQKYPWVKDQSG